MVRCTTCNHRNSPVHRFCGMCGASLPAVASGQVDADFSSNANPRLSVTGPSFLGLAEPSSEAGSSYLLEDEPRRGHGIVYLAFVLLLVTGAVLAWHWRSQGNAWRVLMASRRMLGTASTPVGTAATPVGTDPGGTAPGGDQKTAVSAASPAPSIVPNDGEQQSSLDHVPDETVASVSPAQPPAFAEARKLEQASSSDVAAPTSDEQSKPSASAQRANQWASVGQSHRYEYAADSRSDCDRMRNSAFVAAEHEDAGAQSALGAMFATGRCVELDLPSAYHWLSRAARNDPANPGVASELRIVWREMTAQQQQAALHLR
jgi:hypothetical protein